MRPQQWFRNWLAQPRTRQVPLSPRRGLPRRRGVVPRLEVLEDRTLTSTFLVANLNDSGAGSLRAAVQSADANPGSTIKFAAGLHGTITLTSGELDITSSTTINGPGANKLSVSGNNASRIFHITDNSSVSIAGLTLTEGLATSGGGILLQDSAALSISNCKLIGNEAIGNVVGGGYGGGIEDTSAAALTVTDCSFDANKAIGIDPNSIPGHPGYKPGAVFAYGGAIDLSPLSTGPATISNSTFIGNQALGGSPGASAAGGALNNSSNAVGGIMTVTGCTLSDNAAIGAAGGDGVINFGSGQGGAINASDSLIVLNSTLTDNLALGTPLAPGAVPSQTLASGSATAGGGIFCLFEFVPTATVTVADSTLTGNRAVGGAGAPGATGSVGDGGGICLVAVPSALVTDCTLSHNVARGGAGGSGAVGAPGISGGLDLAFGSSVTVLNTSFLHNQAIGGAGGSGSKGGNGVGGGINDGSAVLLGASDNCSLTLSGSTLLGNLAQGGAGGTGGNGGNGNGGGFSVLAGSSARISGSTLLGNLAQGGAGGTGGNGGNGNGGGAFIGTGATLRVTQSDITRNLALGGRGGPRGSDDEGIGGGVYDLGTFTELAALIVGNFASTSNDNIYP